MRGAGREYEWELMPLALDQGIGTLVWSPLGWARLTGKIGRGRPKPAASRLNSRLAAEAGPPVDDEYLYRVVDALDAVAAETGKSVPQIALNWLLQPRGRSRALPGGARAREGMGTRPGFPSKRPTVASVIIGARRSRASTPRARSRPSTRTVISGSSRSATRRRSADVRLDLAPIGTAWPNSYVRPEDLRSFAQRDWARVERAKLAYWTRQYEEHASGPSLHAADGLRAHVLRFAPAALRAQRALDFEDLLRLQRRIDAANARLRR
jgi:hypothetical protein